MSRIGRRPSFTRLASLEQAQSQRRPAPVVRDRFTEEEWLTGFKNYSAQGLYINQSGFPQALAEYERALADAEAGDPPFQPPADFLPEEPDYERRLRWRSSRYDPEVNRTITMLLEMSQQAIQARQAAEASHAQ